MAYRIDLWLKHVCLYKHRSEATDECNGGKVKLNGKSTKASTNIKVGDVVEFTRGEWDRKFVVTAVPEKQLAKDTAQTAYRDESGEKPDRKDVIAKMLETPTRDRGTGRPTKKDRRALEREGFGNRE